MNELKVSRTKSSLEEGEWLTCINEDGKTIELGNDIGKDEELILFWLKHETMHVALNETEGRLVEGYDEVHFLVEQVWGEYDEMMEDWNDMWEDYKE